MEAGTPNLHLNIKSWAEEDRPREKLLIKGRSALSDAELLGILIGSGTKSLSAVDLGKVILREANNDINQLAKFSITELQKIKGIGEAKALSITAALELGRRRKELEVVEKAKIIGSKAVFEIMKCHLLDLRHEEFWVLLLNRANQLIKTVQISSGGVSGTVVDIKMVFKQAIDNLSSSIILIHNHPSGNLKPSNEDVRITKQIKEGGIILDIPLLDHIIFTDSAYFSFADENLL